MNTPTESEKEASVCATLDEVRTEIDALDVEIVRLLARRSTYVVQAARFKPTAADVVVPARIEAIAAMVRGHAERFGADPDLIEAIYRGAIDAFIAFEHRTWHGLVKDRRGE